jgi:S1-C subfamily serine protease
MAQQLNLGSENLPKGVGSGFVWDNAGHIVTNFHVINKVDTALVTLTNKNGETKQYTAKLTGVDPDKDIAVLKVDADPSELRPIPLGATKTVKVGQYALAIGNPFGQDHTLTTGVISGKNREITAPTGRKIKGVIQTDAAINPGNSGGPLLDSSGRLIGVNTASLGAGVSAGVGFALPIETVRSSVDQIIEFGAVQRAILGITYLERLPTPAESERSGIPRIERGVVVLDVPASSPALAAGLQGVSRSQSADGKPSKTTLGDVIVGLGSYDIKAPGDLTAALENFKPGERVKLKVLRGPEQKPVTLELALGSFKGSTFTGLESERPVKADASSTGVPLNVPLGEIAPQITPRMPDGPVIP